MKYLVVAIEYFTKWIEAEPVAQITCVKRTLKKAKGPGRKRFPE